MVHFYNGGNTLRRTEPQNGNIRRIGNRISIERDDLEGVPRQGEAANFRGAAIQNVKENALSSLDSDGFAMAQHPAVNGKEFITNFVPVWHAFGEGRFHG